MWQKRLFLKAQSSSGFNKKKNGWFEIKYFAAGLDLEEGSVWRESPCQPELLPHHHTEESLRQGFGVRGWSGDACTQQNFPACWRGKVRYFVVSSSQPSFVAQVFFQWRQDGSLALERWQVKLQVYKRTAMTWGLAGGSHKLFHHSNVTVFCSCLTHKCCKHQPRQDRPNGAILIGPVLASLIRPHSLCQHVTLPHSEMTGIPVWSRLRSHL